MTLPNADVLEMVDRLRLERRGEKPARAQVEIVKYADDDEFYRVAVMPGLVWARLYAIPEAKAVLNGTESE